MRVAFQAVRVAVPEGDEARLAFADDRLVAVLVRLPEEYEPDGGRWFLEAGFTRLDGVQHPTFANLDEAEAWIAARMGGGG